MDTRFLAYKEDVERVKTLLLEIAREHPLALNEPEPLWQPRATMAFV